MVFLCDWCNEFIVYGNAFSIEWLSVKYIVVKNKCEVCYFLKYNAMLMYHC